MIKAFYKIFIITTAASIVGGIFGFAFYFFFEETAVLLIEKFKFIQSIFGIETYREGMSFPYIFLVIFLGNLISTIGYFGLGYIRAVMPVAFITGFLITVLLFTGTVRHSRGIPADVIILVSVEAFYRVLALSTGEYANKNKFKNEKGILAAVSFIIILFLFGVFFEVYSIFGSIF
ncbi:MAG: hypothetical protein R6U35_03430 [Candidatus Humimicrobiaceae bacterium]